MNQTESTEQKKIPTCLAKCHYCPNPAKMTLVWKWDRIGRPARITMPWCGCDIQRAWEQHRGTRSVERRAVEINDYEIQPLIGPYSLPKEVKTAEEIPMFKQEEVAGLNAREAIKTIGDGITEQEKLTLVDALERYVRNIPRDNAIAIPWGITYQRIEEVAIRVFYTNHRGESGWRRIIPIKLEWGSNMWYPEEQWLFHCFDLEKKAERSFALLRIRFEEKGEKNGN